MEKYILDTCTWIEFFHERNVFIGATALHYDLTVVTDNFKHFSLMPGVKVENWLERNK